MTKFRLYDYALGRFTSVDPLADLAPQESYTPYHYASNNPIRYSDPNGDCFKCELEKVGKGFNALGNLLGINQVASAVVDGVKAIDNKINEYRTGENNSPPVYTDMEGGVQLEGNAASDGAALIGPVEETIDVKIFQDAWGVGGAPNSTPSGTAEIVKTAASEVVNTATNASNTVTEIKEYSQTITQDGEKKNVSFKAYKMDGQIHFTERDTSNVKEKIID